ncbi:hypothetical protein KAJ27_02900 [bacterium]|nr:hypothetical protein [bacterium]
MHFAKKIIIFVLLFTFTSGIFSPVLFCENTQSTYDIAAERKGYQNLYFKQIAAEKNQPLDLYKQWYLFGKGHFPFGTKTANFLDTSVTVFKYVHDPKTYFNAGQEYNHYKKLFGSVFDIITLVDKTKLRRVTTYLREYSNSFLETATIERITDCDGTKLFSWIADAMGKKIGKTIRKCYKTGLEKPTIQAYEYMIKVAENPKVLRWVANLLYMDKYLNRLPSFIKNVTDTVKNVKLAVSARWVKISVYLKTPAVKKKIKMASDGISFVAEALDVMSNFATLHEYGKDEAFNTISGPTAVLSGIKLLLFIGSKIAVTKVVCKILDSILTVGEMAYVWISKKYTILSCHQATLADTGYTQFNTLFLKVWEHIESNRHRLKNFSKRVLNDLNITTYRKKSNTEYAFDIDKFRDAKFLVQKELTILYDDMVSRKYGSTNNTPNYPLKKPLYRAMASMIKNIPLENTMTAAQIEIKNKIKAQICIAGFYQANMLSGSVDHYIKDKNVLKLDDAVPWYDFFSWTEGGMARSNFLRRNTEFKSLHFKLFRQDAYKILSRFDKFRVKLKADLNSSTSPSTQISIFNMGFHFHIFEYEVLLKKFMKWDISIVQFANRLRMFFNLCDDIKLHNELVKHARDQITKMITSWDFGTVGYSTNYISSHKKYRTPTELQIMFERIIRSTCFKIAKEIQSTLEFKKISLTYDVAEDNMRQYEEDAINTLFSNKNAIFDLLTTSETENDSWFFSSNGIQKVKGLELAPVSRKQKINIPSILLGYLAEFEVMRKSFHNICSAYDILCANREALIVSTESFINNELWFPKGSTEKPLMLENMEIYTRYVKLELKKYLEAAQLCMDNESSSSLRAQYKSIMKKGKKIQTELFIKQGKLFTDDVNKKVIWLDKIKKTLFNKITSLNGKIEHFFIFSVDNIASRQKIDYPNVMLYPPISIDLYGDYTFSNGEYGKPAQDIIKTSLRLKLNIPDENFTFAPPESSGEYNWKVTKQRHNFFNANSSPIFLIIEKISLKNTKPSYLIHMVY